MKRRWIWVACCILVTASAVGIYLARDNSPYEPSLDEVILHAQQAAFELYLHGRLESNPDTPLSGPAKTKSKATADRGVPDNDVYKRLGVRFPLVPDLPPFMVAAVFPGLKDFKLMALERVGPVVVMTFALCLSELDPNAEGFNPSSNPPDEQFPLWEPPDSIRIVSIPGKGPVLFGLATEFVHFPADASRLAYRLAYMVAKLPVIRGRWLRTEVTWRLTVRDFHLTAVRADLVDWLEQHSAEAVRESERREQSADDREASTESVIGKMYIEHATIWTSKTLREQVNHVAAYLLSEDALSDRIDTAMRGKGRR